MSRESVIARMASIPEEVKKKALHAARLYLMENLLAAFQKAGIRVLVVRGMAFSCWLYDSPVERAMGDIDLIIFPDDREKGERILRKLGLNRELCGDINYVKGDLHVDMHLGLWYAEDLEGLFARAVRVPIGAAAALTLSPEDAFLDLAFYGVAHCGTIQEKTYEDAQRLLARQDLRWPVVLETAARNGWGLPLALFVEDLGASRIPAPRVPASRGILTWLIRRIRALDWSYKGFLLQVLVQPGPRRKAEFAFSCLFPGRDFIERRYGEGWWAAKAILRPFFLLRNLIIASQNADDIDAGIRELYETPAEIEAWRFSSMPEAEQREEELLERHFRKPGALLVVGCGAGRETVLFARAGHEVTGLDPSGGMIGAAREEAEKARVSCRFVRAGAQSADFKPGEFDYVLFDRTVLSMILGRENRLAVLRRAAGWLKPEGALCLSACFREPDGLRQEISWRLRRLASPLLRRAYLWEKGDTLMRPGIADLARRRVAALHRFLPEEVAGELREAGLETVWEGPGPYWIARRKAA